MKTLNITMVYAAYRYLSSCLCFVLCTSISVAQQQETDSVALCKKIEAMSDRVWIDYAVELKKVWELHQEAIDLSCQGCQSRSHRMLGRYYQEDGDYPACLLHLRKALVLARSSGDRDNVVSTLNNMGTTFYYQAYYDSASYFYHEALKIHEQDKNMQGQITVLHNISLMHHRRGNFNKAIEYLFRGEELKDKMPHSIHELEAMGAMGGLMIDSIYYLDEIAEEMKELETYRKNGDKRAMHRTYRNIGKAYQQLEQYKLSARYFLKAARVVEELGLIPDFDLVGQDYRQAGMRDSSFYYHYMAKRYFPKRTQSGIGITLEMLGHAHRQYGNPDSAVYYYDSAFRLNYRINNRISFTGIHRHLVHVHTQLRNFDEAEHHLKTGLALAKEVALIHQKNLYQEGKFLYEQKKDFEKALWFSEKYRIYLDSINRAETALNMTRLQAEFKTAKKTREVEELKQRNLLHEAKLDTRNLQIILAATVIIVVASIGTLYYSRYRQKIKSNDLLTEQKNVIELQNAELQKQNRTKEILMSEIHHRVKNNLQIISSLIHLKSRHAVAETNEILHQLNGRILSMGLIHEKLYTNDNLQWIRLDHYLSELGNHLLDSFEAGFHLTGLTIDSEEIETDAEVALTCGLICNEVFTNTLKHAFDETQTLREIRMGLRKIEDTIVFTVSDNGLRTIMTGEDVKRSFGMRFIDQLVTSRLEGTWTIKYEKGFHVRIAFPLKSPTAIYKMPDRSMDRMEVNTIL